MRQYMSHPLDILGPRPPAIPAPSLTEFMTVARDGASVQQLSLFSHTGTHVDTSAHVLADGRSIVDFPPESLVFDHPMLLSLRLPDDAAVLPEHLAALSDPAYQSADMLLIHFGLEGIRAREPARFANHSPGLTVAAARHILSKLPALRALGMDAPSVACIARLQETMAAHHLLLSARGGRFLAVEEMKLNGRAPSRLTIQPWLVEGMHSGPCSVVGEFEEIEP